MNHVTAPIGHITDAEIAAAIRYLDPTPSGNTTGGNADTVIVFIFSVVMFALAALPFVSLYLTS